MEVTIPVPAVRELVTGMGRIISSKTFLQYIWVQPEKKGIRFMGTNADETAVFFCPEATAKGKDGFAINLDELRIVMREVRGDTLSITVRSNDLDVRFCEDLWNAVVTLEKNVVTEPPFSFDLFTGWEPVEYPNFLSDYRFALPFCSKDSTRWILNGVCFHEDGSVVATDGRRLVVKREAHPFKLPKSDAKWGNGYVIRESRWLKNAKPVDGVQATREHLRVKAGDWQYIVKPLDGRFPNYQQVIPEQTPNQFFELCDDAIRAFRLIEGLLSDRDKCVRLEALKTKTKLVLNATNHKDNRKVKIDMEGKGSVTFATGLNVTYMIQALQAGFRKFHQLDNLSPSVSFHEGWQHILMPMRVAE